MLMALFLIINKILICFLKSNYFLPVIYPSDTSPNEFLNVLEIISILPYKL